MGVLQRTEPWLRELRVRASRAPQALGLAASATGFGLALLLSRGDSFAFGTLLAWILAAGAAGLLAEREPGLLRLCPLDVLSGALLCAALLGLAGGAAPSPMSLLLALFAERACAAWSPPPLAWIRTRAGSLGLVLDDWGAALYSVGVLALLRALLPDLVWTLA